MIPMNIASRRNFVNLFALTCIQASNALIPLLIVPFVLSRIGAAAYAQIAVAEAVSMIAVATVLFSFEVDGVARIAGLNPQEDRATLSHAVSGIITTRLLLFLVVATVVMAGFCLLTDYSPFLLAFWLLVPLGQVFHSYWFYQGIETNLPPAIITLTSRAISVAVALYTIRGPADQLLMPLAIGAPFAIAGLISLAYKCRFLHVRLEWVGFDEIIRLLRHGSRIFIGNAAVIMYREINVLLLEIAGVNVHGIAAYSLVEKTVKMLQACTRPLSQLFFPKLLTALREIDAPTPSAARTIARYTIPQLTVVTAVLAIAPITYLLVGPYWPWLAQFGRLPHVAALLAIMAPATLFGLANFMYGSAGLNYLNARSYQLRSILITGVASAVLCTLLSHIFGVMAAGACFIGAEAFLFVLVLGRYFGRQAKLERGAR